MPRWWRDHVARLYQTHPIRRAAQMVEMPRLKPVVDRVYPPLPRPVKRKERLKPEKPSAGSSWKSDSQEGIQMKNGKIKVGVIGVHPEQGWATTAHIPALQASPDYELVALTNSNGQLARQAADKVKVPNAFESHLDLLKLPDIDLVVVTVKVPNHFELVSAALKPGKAVYCEWPLGRNVAEAVELAKLAKDQQVCNGVGLQSRATPVVSYVRDLIKEGYVGEVLSTSLEIGRA